MQTSNVQYLTMNSSIKLAYQHIAGKSPGVMFCCGYMSDMTGSKAIAVENFCREQGIAFTRFDYRAHGQSTGDILDATISLWRDDALAIFDNLTQGQQIIIGSSMGGWIALLTALARPDRVSGLIGIAAAPDFTEELIWQKLNSVERETLQREKIFYEPNNYSEQPYAFTWQLIEDGRHHLLLSKNIKLSIPVRLLHGMRDPDVPWQTSVRIVEKLQSDDARAILIKDGDHRLSRDQDLKLLMQTLAEFF